MLYSLFKPVEILVYLRPNAALSVSASLAWLVPGLFVAPVLLLQVEPFRVFVEHWVLGVEARSPFAILDEVAHHVGATPIL